MPTLEENKARFLELCGLIKRNGIADLINWLESSDFFVAPASSRFHGCYAGGLLEHTANRSMYSMKKRSAARCSLQSFPNS